MSNTVRATQRDMAHWAAWIVVALLSPASSVAAVSPAPETGAAMNYLLHCQGCHQEDGSGRTGYVPSFRDSVSRFLAIPEGRAYLGRVPGTSQSMLDDRARADLLNWIVVRFDRQNVPRSFSPYTARELARYRRESVSQAGIERARLVKLLAAAQGGKPPVAPSATAATAGLPDSGAIDKPPPPFAICEACHSTSTDGASAMGPNLRGVAGRRAGSLPGYTYSAAMSASQIVWSREELDAFLTNAPAKVPGTYMVYPGVVDPAERAAVVEYLLRLR